MTVRTTWILAICASLILLAGPAPAHEPGRVMMMEPGAGGMGPMGRPMMDMMMGRGSGMGMMGGPMMDGPMMGGSMMDAPMGPGMAMGLLRMLRVPDLSDEQRRTLTRRHRDLQRQLLQLQQKALDARFAAQDAFAEDTPDPAAVGRALQGVFDVHRQMVEATIAARNDMRQALTDEQREALESPRRNMGMPMRGAMGHPQ